MTIDLILYFKLKLVLLDGSTYFFVKIALMCTEGVGADNCVFKIGPEWHINNLNKINLTALKENNSHISS